MTAEYPILCGAGDTSSPQIMRAWSNPYVVCGTMGMPDGGGFAYRWDLRTNSFVTFNLMTMTAGGGNPIELPFYDIEDGHYQLASAMDDQDKLHVLGNHHDGHPQPAAGMHYVVCNDTSPSGFVNQASWVVPADAEPGATLDSSADGGTYTYQYFDRLSDGRLILFQSQSPARLNSRGRCVLAWIKSGGAAWAPLMGGATANARFMQTDSSATLDVEADRAYVGQLIIEPRNGFDWVHFGGHWRTNDATADSQQQPFYLVAKSTDFTQWYTADGLIYPRGASVYPSTTRSMPITWFNRGAATITGLPGRNYLGSLSMWIDPNTGSDTAPGFPTITIRNGDSLGGNLAAGTSIPTNTWLNYTWNGSAWVFVTAPNFTGVMREFIIGGYRMVRTNQGTRVNLRNVATGKNVALGLKVRTNGTSFSPTPCPVWLREGKFVCNVNDGATPKVQMWPPM
jgi:hypothetical protein